MYQYEDKDVQNLQIIQEVLNFLKILAKDDISIKPYFIEALIYVTLSFRPKYANLNSKLL